MGEIKTRIQLKSGIEEYWRTHNFIPLKGEVIFYLPDENNINPRLKVGDGLAYLIDLPFINDSFDKMVKVDTTINWNKKNTFIPLAGEIIIYSDRTNIIKNGQEVNIPGIKIGDGSAYLIDLPFIDEDHITNNSIHVTSEEKLKWNNKITCEDTILNENLILSRN